MHIRIGTTADEEDHRSFKGLPSPAAAMVVCGLIALFCTKNNPDAELGHLLLKPEHFDLIVVTMPAVLVLLGLLMVSRVPYPHALHTILKGRHSMPFLAALVVMIIVAAVEWQLALVVCTTGYVAWGLLMWVGRLVIRRRDDDDEDDGEPEPGARTLPSRN